MTQREKIVRLIQDAVGGCSRYWAELIADNILEKYEAIPIAAIKRKINGIDAADGCDQASAWELQRRNALKDLLDWYKTPDYKLTIEHTWF